MTLKALRGMHPPVKDAVKELQGLRVNLVAGAAADINATVAEIKQEDTIVSSINNNAGALTTVDPATLTIADAFARGSAVFNTVIATDEITINALSYVGVSGAKSDNTEFSVDGGDAAAVLDLVDSINSRDSDNVVAVANGTTLEITAVVEGTVGNAITFVSADTTITETGSGTLINGTGVKASGTLTIVSALAGEQVVVDGLTYTAVATGAGTTGKFDEFEIGGTDTITAANLVAAINGRESRPGGGGNVIASNAAGVVTVTDNFFGIAGNSVTLVGSANITASGATLENGAAVGGAIRAASAFDQLILTWFNKR